MSRFLGFFFRFFLFIVTPPIGVTNGYDDDFLAQFAGIHFARSAHEYYVLNNMYSEENYLEAFGGEVVGIVDKISIFGEF